jgi:AcrR family transcriptional regulator
MPDRRPKSPSPAPRRRYSGQSFADRHEGRREKLIRAALAVAGRYGLEATSVAAICAEAGLTARYFYESFPSRDAIFVEAYRLAQEELLAEIALHIDPADPVGSALKGFYASLAAHPGAARVFLVDIDDSATAWKEASREGAGKLATLFAQRAKGKLAQAGVLGAIIQIAKRWIDAGFDEPIAKVVATALPFTQIEFRDGTRRAR